MKDKYFIIAILSILIGTFFIAQRPIKVEYPQVNTPNINITSDEAIIQLAENRIAVIDNRSNS